MSGCLPMIERIKNRISGERAARRRETLIAKQHGKCFWCDEPMLPVKVKGDGNPKALTATIDHKIPLADGGKNLESNTVAAHYKCNQERNTAWQKGEA